MSQRHRSHIELRLRSNSYLPAREPTKPIGSSGRRVDFGHRAALEVSNCGQSGSLGRRKMVDLILERFDDFPIKIRPPPPLRASAESCVIFTIILSMRAERWRRRRRQSAGSLFLPFFLFPFIYSPSLYLVCLFVRSRLSRRRRRST